jgi:hypothetical protein
MTEDHANEGSQPLPLRPIIGSQFGNWRRGHAPKFGGISFVASVASHNRSTVTTFAGSADASPHVASRDGEGR